MNKYIPADKLIAEIERYKQGAAIARFDNAGENADYFQGKIDLCDNLTHIITSLQQEQSDVDLEKEIDSFLNEAGAPFFWCNDDEQKEWCKIIARHFAEWGAIHLNARKEVQK